MMNMTSFLQDKKLTIALKGEIDHHSAKDTMRIIGNKIDIYLPLVCVLDFRDVTFMDSSGIAIVIHAIRRMRELRGVVRVENVHTFPGHIACDTASRSEIVIPLRNADGAPFGVMDIDSPEPDRFSSRDAETLEAFAAIVSERCHFR